MIHTFLWTTYHEEQEGIDVAINHDNHDFSIHIFFDLWGSHIEKYSMKNHHEPLHSLIKVTIVHIFWRQYVSCCWNFNFLTFLDGVRFRNDLHLFQVLSGYNCVLGVTFDIHDFVRDIITYIFLNMHNIQIISQQKTLQI